MHMSRHSRRPLASTKGLRINPHGHSDRRRTIHGLCPFRHTVPHHPRNPTLADKQRHGVSPLTRDFGVGEKSCSFFVPLIPDGWKRSPSLRVLMVALSPTASLFKNAVHLLAVERVYSNPSKTSTTFAENRHLPASISVSFPTTQGIRTLIHQSIGHPTQAGLAA